MILYRHLNQGRDPHLYFYRDNKGHEIDLIYKQGSNLIPIEIKSAQTINKDFFKGLEYFRELVGPRANESYLVYAGDKSFEIQEATIINYNDVAVITQE